MRVRLDARFDLVSQSTRAGLVAVKTSAGRTIGIVFVGTGGKLGFKDAITGVTTMSTRKVSRGAWHRLELQLSVGAADRVQISLDGVSALDLSGDLGSAAAGRCCSGTPPLVARSGYSSTTSSSKAPERGLFGVGQLTDHGLLREPGADRVHERFRLLDERHVSGLLDHHQP